MAERCNRPKKDGTACQSFVKHGHNACAAHLGLVGRKPTLGSEAGDELQARLVAFLRNGNQIDTACAVSGCSVPAFYAWRERGEADIEADVASPYREFTEAVTRARAEGEAALVQEIRNAARGTERSPGDWRAAAFVLERSYAERWRQRQEVRHSGGVSTRTEPPAVPETPERLLTVASLMAEIGVLPQSNGHVPSSNGQSPHE